VSDAATKEHTGDRSDNTPVLTKASARPLLQILRLAAQERLERERRSRTEPDALAS